MFIPTATVRFVDSGTTITGKTLVETYGVRCILGDEETLYPWQRIASVKWTRAKP